MHLDPRTLSLGLLALCASCAVAGALLLLLELTGR